MNKLLCLFLVSLLISACSSLQQRSYSPGEVSINSHYEKMKNDKSQALRELGLQNTNLDSDQQSLVDSRILLNQLESGLRTETEKTQYYTYKPALKTDARRIFFLKLPTPEQRERLATRLGLNQKLNQNSSYEKEAINQNDIFIGMSKKAVKESWGDPEVIDVAGNPIYGNERWLYSAYVATPDGFVRENRVLFFEGGRIVGWQKN